MNSNTVSGVPTTTPRGSAREFFLYVSASVTLLASIISLVTLTFSFIDYAFETSYGWYDPYQGPARFAIATLAVVFPLFLFFTRKVNQDVRKNTEHQQLTIRKWLLSITLFISGVVLAIDGIVLINAFLSGEELTVAFLLKVLCIVIIVGATFWYYFNDLKGTWIANEKTSKMIGFSVTGAIVLLVIGGILMIGSPATMRQMRNDQERVWNLESIQNEIIAYYQAKGRIPPTIKEAFDPLMGTSMPSDPTTQAPYEYTVNAPLSFSLCATFEEASPKIASTEMRNGVDVSWQHEEGKTCFTRTIDPDRYPLINSNAMPSPLPLKMR